MFFKKINKIDIPPRQKDQGKKIQIIIIRNRTGDITIDFTDINRIIRNTRSNSANKSDSLDGLWKTQTTKPQAKREKDNPDSPVSADKVEFLV